jgi:xanthine dehydrogenase FAD-binding subunit
VVVAAGRSLQRRRGGNLSKSAADIHNKFEAEYIDPMNLWQHYLQPENVMEALQALASASGPACLIAGGTDLMLDLQQGRHAPVHTLVDLTAIPELTSLEICCPKNGYRQEQLFIGAAVPLSRIARSALVIEHARALVEACDLIGGPQGPNMATLGGKVAHALPAADGTLALMALNAQAEIASLEEYRRVPLSDLFVGPGQSTLKTGQELLTGFYIPLRNQQQGSAFKRIMRAQGIALPILNLSVWLERRADLIADVRVAVGPSGPTPRRIIPAEDSLRGQKLNPESCTNALNALLDNVHFRTSPYRASAEYRQQLVEVLLNDTLHTAWQRAGSL